ncbi:MAG: hypothetical protein K8R21_11460, partial [Leptospira sp.]|nr:hypothetical protein [Leptospira sp.]
IRNENILLIDNFGTDRNAFPHHDVLPNPETDFLETLENTLLPSLIDLYAQEKDEKIVTIYSGNLTPEYTRVIDKIIAENFGKNFRLIRIGNADSDQEIEVRNRVFRKEYFELLGKSEFFISYFGQSVMEALYMQKKIVLFSISDYHEKLAEFLSEKTGIFHIGNILNAKLQCKIDPEKIKKPEIIIRNRGFTILLEKIRNLCL